MGGGCPAALCRSFLFFFSPSTSSISPTNSALTSSRTISSTTIRMASPSDSHNNNHLPSFSSSSSSTSIPSKSPSPSSVIDFLTLCHRLKTTKRAGWVIRGVNEPESVADHMYRMGIMALVSHDMPDVDRERCIKMAIVHDIAEAIVGDITPSDGVPKLEKSRREQEALRHMCELLGNGERAKEISDLWMEYEENSSLEAKVVKDFDKIEMILQALEYETEQEKDLEEFFQSTAGKFQTDIGKSWAAEIVSRRKRK